MSNVREQIERLRNSNTNARMCDEAADTLERLQSLEAVFDAVRGGFGENENGEAYFQFTEFDAIMKALAAVKENNNAGS